MRALPLLAAGVLALGCSDDPAPPSGGGGAGGSSARTLTVQVGLFVGENQPLRLLADGDPLDLWNATQGGHVARIGARIVGLGGETILLRSRLRDPITQELVAEDTRTVDTDPVEGEPGVQQTNIRTGTQVNHVPLCPNYDPVSLLTRELLLEVQVTELYVLPQPVGSAVVRVRPTCGSLTEEPARCVCECEANYTLGKCN